MLKVQDLRKETIGELESRLEDLRKKNMEFRFGHASGTLKNPLRLRIIRRDIAKIITVVSEMKSEPRPFNSEEKQITKVEPDKKKKEKKKGERAG